MIQPISLFWVLATFLCSDLLAGLGVLASLYPTKPVASTIYVAGQAAQVSWAEDWKTPLLNATAGVRIDLYAGNNVSGLRCVKLSGMMSLFLVIWLIGLPSLPTGNFCIWLAVSICRPSCFLTHFCVIFPSLFLKSYSVNWNRLSLRHVQKTSI